MNRFDTIAVFTLKAMNISMFISVVTCQVRILFFLIHGNSDIHAVVCKS